MNSRDEFEDEIDQLREEYLNSFPVVTVADYDAELASVIGSDDYTFDEKLQITAPCEGGGVHTTQESEPLASTQPEERNPMEAIAAMYGERTQLRSEFESGSVPLDYYWAQDVELSARLFRELGDGIQRQGVVQWATGAEEMQHLVNRKFNQIATTK